MTRRYARKFSRSSGRKVDIPAPDVYTDAQTNGVDYGHVRHDRRARGARRRDRQAGFDWRLGRPHGRNRRGILFRRRGSLQGEENKFARRECGDSGFGNVGSAVARLFMEKKAKIIAISDSRGGVHNPRGIDPLRAMRYKERSGTVVGMPGASRISNDELLDTEVRHPGPRCSRKCNQLHNADQINKNRSGKPATAPRRRTR